MWQKIPIQNTSLAYATQFTQVINHVNEMCVFEINMLRPDHEYYIKEIT